MTKLWDTPSGTALIGHSHALSRRVLLKAAGTGLLLGAGLAAFPAAGSEPEEEMLFNDPAVPVGGNKKGSLTIVTFFDYNCPFCRRSSMPLDEVVREDGDIRLLYKDWPILTEASTTGALLALAAHRQDRYEAAHNALMVLENRADEAQMTKAVRGSGVDMARLDTDLERARSDIEALLRRNNDQAELLGLRGTPAYIVGPFLVTSALEEAGFRQVVKDARERLAQEQ